MYHLFHLNVISKYAYNANIDKKVTNIRGISHSVHVYYKSSVITELPHLILHRLNILNAYKWHGNYVVIHSNLLQGTCRVQAE